MAVSGDVLSDLASDATGTIQHVAAVSSTARSDAGPNIGPAPAQWHPNSQNEANCGGRPRGLPKTMRWYLGNRT